MASFCRCIAVPKLADEDEFMARQQGLIDGESVPDRSYARETSSKNTNEVHSGRVFPNSKKLSVTKTVFYKGWFFSQSVTIPITYSGL